MAQRVEVPLKICAAKGCSMPLIRKRYGKKGILEQHGSACDGAGHGVVPSERQ